MQAKRKKMEEETKIQPSKSTINTSDKHLSPPFPSRLNRSKKEEQHKEILKTNLKVEVNMPLIDAIKQVLRYAKFFKKLCTNKKRSLLVRIFW